MKIDEKKFLRDVEKSVGFSLSAEQSAMALGVLSDAVARESFDADERAESEVIKANYRSWLRRTNRVKG